jgi:hypothetical protein
MQSCIVFVFVAASKGSCKDFAIYALKKKFAFTFEIVLFKNLLFYSKIKSP